MKIIYIPNIFEKRDRQTFEVEYKEQTVEAYWDQTVGGEVDKTLTYPVITGKRAEWDAIPTDEDEIIFITDVSSGRSIWSYVIGAVLVIVGIVLSIYGYGAGAPLIGAGLGMIAGAVASDLMKPSTPDMPKTPTGFGSSPTYAWEGIQNIFGEGATCPVVYGEHRVGGAVIEAFTDGDVETGELSSQYLNVLLAVSEGPIESINTDKIYINKEEIGYFGNSVQYDWRDGSQRQTTIPWFSKIHRKYNISGANLKYNSPYIYKTYGEIESARLEIALPCLYHVNQDGTLTSAAVYFNVHIAPQDTGVYTLVGTYGIEKNSKSAVRLQIHVNAPARGKYLIKVTRATGDYTDQYNNGDSYFTSVHEIEDAALTYPNTALLGLRIRATDKISGQMPNLTCLVKGRKIKDVRNLAGAAAWSNNPANIIYDLLINERFGLGHHITDANIDLQSLHDFADWCDEEVTFTYYDGATGSDKTATEKRYEFNIVLDTNFKANEIIQKICASCRAVGTFIGDKFTVIIDRETDPVQMFSMGNIIEDSFSEDYFGLKDVPNQMEVQILDAEDEFNRATIVAVDEDRADEPIKSKTIQLYGLTTKSRAKREVLYSMKRAHALKHSISFQAGYDAVICELGQIILFQHKTPAWGIDGGRIKAVDGVRVTLDTEVSLTEGKDYRLRVRKNDGTFVFYDFTSGVTDTISTISLQVEPDITAKDLYAFGEMAKDTKPFRVIGLTLGSDKKNTILAEDFYEALYHNDNSVHIDETNYCQLGITEEYQLDGTVEEPQAVRIATNGPAKGSFQDIPPFVTDVTVSERVEMNGDATVPVLVVDFASVSMPPNSLAQIRNYEMIYSIDAGTTWHHGGYTTGNKVELRNAEIGKTYNVLVKPWTTYGLTNAIENSMYALYWNTSISGATAIPVKVQNFQGIQVGEFIKFIWDKVTNTNIKYYEIRMDGWAYGVRLGTTAQTTYQVTATRTGNVKYYIKAFNYAGQPSPDAAEYEISVAQYINKNILFTKDNRDDSWSGIKYGFVPNGPELEMPEGTTDAIYYPEMVKLDEASRSRTYVLFKYDAVIGNTTKWDDWVKTWDNSPERWEIAAEGDEITVANEISTYDGTLPADCVDIIRLNKATGAESGATPSASANITYGDGHFHYGLNKTGTASLEYDVTMPDAWSILFRFKLPDILAAGSICRFTNATQTLTLFLNNVNGTFRVSDGTNNIDVQVDITAGDNMRLGVSTVAGGGFIFYVGNATTGDYNTGTGSLTFTKPTKVKPAVVVAPVLAGVLSDMAIRNVVFVAGDAEALTTSIKPYGFTDFRRFIDGEYNFRDALFSIRAANADPGTAQSLTMTEHVIVCDVYDVIESGTASIDGVTRVNFAKTFHSIPVVTITGASVSAFAIPEVTAITKTYFDVKLKLSNGTNTTGTVWWQAHGY